MKSFYYTLLFSFLTLISCSVQQKTETPIDNKMVFEPNDEGEYDIIVMDPQYDVYLKTIAQPKFYYNESYYKTKNRIYTTIWNQRHMNPLKYNTNLYAVSIDLDPNINYGLEFEYKLYNFFKFIEWKYKIRLI